MRKLGFIWILLLIAVESFGANGITPGTLVCIPTFESMSVVSPYTGDDNSNATCILQYKKASDGTWMNAYTPIVDRRTNIVFAGNNDNTSNSRQGRGSVVGLTPNTSYNFMVTWTDPDGGGVAVSNTTSTLSFAIANGGADIWVDAAAVSEGDGSSGNPYKTITNAVANAVAGNKIRIKTGTYVGFTISQSGAAGNHLRLVGESGATVVIDGTGLTENMTLGSSLAYVSFENIIFNQSNDYGSKLNGNQHHLWFEQCVWTNISKNATLEDCALLFNSSTVSNIYILNCSLYSSNKNNAVDGLFITKCGPTLVVCSNLFASGFRDNIGSGSTDISHFFNVDYAHNTFTGNQDDGIEMDGPGNNVRCWDNLFDCTNGNSCVSIAPVLVGPAYIFRNKIRRSVTSLCLFKVGDGSQGLTYVFHNTCLANSTGMDVLSDIASEPYSDYITYYNNIFKASRYSIYRGGRSNVYDYNDHLTTGSFLIDEWQTNSSLFYATLAQFVAAQPPNEAHGISADPSLDGWNLLPGSACIDAGIILSNFNTAGSSWPMSGAAPDIGAIELNSGDPALATVASQAYGTLMRVRNSTITINVTNIGGGTLNGNASSDSGNFIITAGSGYGIASGTSIGVDVKFDPLGVAGNYTGNLTLTGGAGAVVPLSGTATNFPTVKLQ